MTKLYVEVSKDNNLEKTGGGRPTKKLMSCKNVPRSNSQEFYWGKMMGTKA